MELIEVKDELGKVLNALQKDRSLLKREWFGEDERITVENLEELADNIVLKYHPDLFGITEYEGQKIREYFQSNFIGNYDILLELHDNFPSVFEKERPEYLNRINERRKSRGLEPISL